MHLLRFSAFLFVSAVLTPVCVASQGWHGIARLRGEVRADDNPFLLDEAHRLRVAAPSPSDVVSGRFRDMDDPADVIAIPSLQLGAQRKGLGGRSLAISADIAYEINVRNSARRHAELQLNAEQGIRKGGDLRFSANWRPSYFHKNYLADAVDLDGDDNIASAERIYTRGTSHEVDVELQYRQHVKAVSAAVSAGYLNRRYDAPFAVRDRRGPDVRGDVAVQVTPVVTVGLGYAVSSLGSDPALSILILDENAFGVDFNGNLTTTDPNARAEVFQDYSRVEQQLDASLRAEARTATVTVGFGRRTRDFGSNEPYDVVNRDRRDVLNAITVSAQFRVSEVARLALSLRQGSQTTNRGGDPASTGDVADYSRHVLWAGVQYRF